MSHPDRQIERITLCAFFLLVLSVIVGTVLTPHFSPVSLPAWLFYSGLGVYCWLTSKGDGVWLGRKGALPLYFGIHVGLYFAISLLPIPKSFLFLLLMPVVNQAALWLKWYVVLGLCVLGETVTIWAVRSDYPSMAAAVRPVVIGTTPAFVFVIAFSWVLKFAMQRKAEAERLSDELEKANAQLRAAAEQIAELAAANERVRIARDIHDGLGHYLTVLGVQLQAAAAHLSSNPIEAAKAVARAEELSRSALEDVRRSVSTLRTSPDPGTLVDRIHDVIAEAGGPVAITVVGSSRVLSAAKEEAIFRLVQEGLTNARKHAHASEIQVSLDFLDRERVRAEVRDNGSGVDGEGENGHGLRGLRERIESVGGTVRTENRSAGGFSLVAEVPV